MNTVLAVATGAVLTAAAGLTLWRLLRGPSVLDRVAASDTLFTVLVIALALAVALGHRETLSIMVTVALVGFLSSVAVARFLPHRPRRDDEAGR